MERKSSEKRKQINFKKRKRKVHHSFYKGHTKRRQDVDKQNEYEIEDRKKFQLMIKLCFGVFSISKEEALKRCPNQ